MLQTDSELLSEFPPVDYETWRALVEKDLEGAPFDRRLVKRTYEGIDIQPLYTAERIPGAVGVPAAAADSIGYPGLPPFTRGGHVLGCIEAGWDIRQVYDEPDPARASRAILDDLSRGATSIELRIDDGPETDRGVSISTLNDLDDVLTNVDHQLIAVALEGGGSFVTAAAMLAALWEKRSVDKAQVRGAFNADPLAALAFTGRLPANVDRSLADMAELAKWTAGKFPHVTAVGVDTAPYHDAGASAAQDLAYSMATAIEYLRAMEHGGLDVNAAARQILFRYSLGCRLFTAIAKLRAARRLWARIVEACGGDEDSRRMSLHVRTARRVLTTRDPWVNMLRNTVCCFAGAVAGADVVTTAPFDAAIGESDEFSRRVARNTQLLLREESQLHRVVDPAGGSWFIEKLTDELAGKAWTILQDIERQGGMSKALLSGRVAEEIEVTWQARLKNLATRKDAITGVSEFPNLEEEPIERKVAPAEGTARRTDRPTSDPAAAAALQKVKAAPGIERAVEAARAGATLIELSSAIHGGISPIAIEPLPRRPYAAPFEALRDASDAHLAEHGRRPVAFLANMGPLAHHTARATWSKNFLEAGGFEVLTNNGFPDAAAAAQAFADSGARVAVICSSDRIYETVVSEVAPKLKEAGARTVILAGNPSEREEDYRTAGVDRFIFLKCDVLATLRELLTEEGVLS